MSATRMRICAARGFGATTVVGEEKGDIVSVRDELNTRREPRDNEEGIWDDNDN